MATNIGKRVAKKRRVFQNSWLEDDKFKLWITPSRLEDRVHCIVCNQTVRCHRRDLVRHSETDKHILNMIECNNKATKNDNTSSSTYLSRNDGMKRVEIKSPVFFAVRNVAFRTEDISIETKVVQDLSLARKKCGKIVKNVIAKREFEKIIECLRTTRFSILIDESTDISDTKLMCIIVKYVSPTDKRIVTQLLDVIPLDSTDCAASKIFQAFKSYFEKHEIPIKNIVGLACDNEAVMSRCNNSLASRLKIEIPNLILLNCLCHTSALIYSKACDMLPSSCESLIREVATYDSDSAKKCVILNEFQNFFDVKRKRNLKLSNTRWLCMHHSIVRLIENWDVLKHFFISAVIEDKLKSAEIIVEYLNDKSIKAYILFLKYSLNFLNSFNALFQSRNILIHKLFENSRNLVQQIGQNFIKPEALKDFANLNIDDKDSLLDVEIIYVGPECEGFLVSLDSEVARNIRLDCMNFYTTAIREMLTRLPLNDIFFQQLTFLDPEVALHYEGRQKIRDLTCIANRVGNVNLNQLAYEWRILPSCFNDEKKKKLASLEIDVMWGEIFKFSNFDGAKMFPNLELLIEVVFSLPHSNAEAKRMFSTVTDGKNKKRNQLSNNTMSSINVVRSMLQSKNIKCTNF